MLLFAEAKRYDNAVAQFFLGEWYFALPLVLMSLVAFALVVWRLLLNGRADTKLDDFVASFQERYQADGAESALEFCRDRDLGLIPSKLYVAGLEAAPQGAAAMRRSMANAIELEILPELNFLLSHILGIAKIATMVGLFFTVISMINTFNAIGKAANTGGDAAVASKGGIASSASEIGLALFATALGLMTAIPLVYAHVQFKDWIAKFETKMKRAALLLVQIVQTVKPGGKGRG